MGVMKKYIRLKFSLLAILGFALLVLNGCQSTRNYVAGIKKTSDLEEMDLKGSIKTLKLKKYRASKNTRTGEIRKGSLSKARGGKNLSYVFDKNGNTTEKTAYNSDGQINMRRTYEYDKKKGQVIERVYDSPAEKLIFKRIDAYDKKGNKTKHLSYTQGEDDEPYKETFKYDKNGNILEEVEYKHSGPLKVQYKYDDQDNLIEMRQFMASNLMMKETYKYDEDGKLATSKQDESRTTHAKYVYEKKYKDGKEAERKAYKDGEPDGRYIYKYNDRGNRIEYQKYDLDNNLIAGEKTEFVYDQENNWINKIPLSKRGIPQYLLEREIEYFEK